jgi:hypothetical protein
MKERLSNKHDEAEALATETCYRFRFRLVI